MELLSEATSTLMDEDEALTFSQLPETLPVYRGAQAYLNEDGLSWTLSLDRAAWFATRFHPDEPVLIQATVMKSEVIALLLGRGEEEVLVFPENLTNLTYLELEV